MVPRVRRLSYWGEISGGLAPELAFSGKLPWPFISAAKKQRANIGAREIRRLAREYAETQPAVIRVGVGAERYPGGGQGIRAVDCLPALVGAWRHVGGGVLQMPVFVPVRFDILSRPDWVNAETRAVNLADIGNVLSPESSLEPPVKSLFIWNANPLSQAPDSNLVEQRRAGLLRYEHQYKKALSRFEKTRHVVTCQSFNFRRRPGSFTVTETGFNQSIGHMYRQRDGINDRHV